MGLTIVDAPLLSCELTGFGDTRLMTKLISTKISSPMIMSIYN
ncbi:hypothetical protein RchiOBHm_Chr3g0473921 [Rosa chinensis]|uniref:Uncharacterized protein n=1 Tax=Rosa chinensis TaxID=74649 RepID=A0A2P6RC06_ROSCH|nr:hypothetical protein RchiOBHm_Chr3g0473921 [Rosa chinensis]